MVLYEREDDRCPRLCFLRLLAVLCFLAVTAAPSHPAEKKGRETHWILISSTHFPVLTDAGEPAGREVAVRLEQMRTEFAQLLMRSQLKTPVPVEIIALKGHDEYVRAAPGRARDAAGFFLRADDRNYVVLDALEPDSWRAVANDYARLLQDYNYPPAQLWFDQGLAEYFSSLELDDKQAWMGADPTMLVSSKENPEGAPSGKARSFADILSASTWLGIPELFKTSSPVSLSPDAGQNRLFSAEAWIVLHYLVNQDKLSETGTYFGLVELQKLPINEAIQKAYGMSAEQFGQAVKDYFNSIEPKLRAAQGTDRARGAGALHQFPAPVTADVTGTSRQDVSEADGDALLAEMEIRIPDRRDDAMKTLNAILSDPKTENAAAHRALAWDDMSNHKTDDAITELTAAQQISPKDPWTHYYLALARYLAAQAEEGEVHGLANTMVDLRAVIDWHPEFAEAYRMLAMAQLEGGGAHAALDSIRVAVQLSPRNQEYLLDLARIYVGGKKWDEATELLNRLTNCPEEKIAREARNELHNLPMLRQYGVPPQAATADQVSPQARPAQTATVPQAASNNDDQEETSVRAQAVMVPAQPDRRLIQFVKGKLVAVDCSQPPAAVLKVAEKDKMLKLRTENYQSLVLIGADKFSCEWKDRPVMVNFKAGGKEDGDLVSLELQ